MQIIRILICSLALFSLNGTDVLTFAQVVPDILQGPSTLQGHFYPQTNADGETLPGYEVVLENLGEETIQNVMLSVVSNSELVAEQPWNCDDLYQNCQQALGDLAPNQAVTETFSFLLLTPGIQAAQSCGIVTHRFEEPTVSITADDMEPFYMTGTGDDLIVETRHGNLCPVLEPGTISGQIYPADTNDSMRGPFIYTIELQNHDYNLSYGTLYFDDPMYEIDVTNSDTGWTYDESDWLPNENNRQRLDIAERLGQSEVITIFLAILPIVPSVVVETEDEAYMELSTPNVVLDGVEYGVEPILLTHSEETLTCRCFAVDSSDSIEVNYRIYLPMIIR